MIGNLVAFFAVAKKILKLKTEYRDYLIFISLSGLGDACYGFSFLRELKKEKNKKLLFLAGRYTAILSECYDFIDETVILTAHEEEIFRRFFGKEDNIFIYNKLSLIFNVINCFPLTEKTYNRLKNNNRSYIDILSDVIREREKKPELPFIKATAESGPGFVDPQKTIIINPRSNSLSFADDSIFLKIISAFKAKGYSIYTNVAGNQMALPDTLPLKCSIEQLYRLSGQVRLFVSIRSGITDFCIGNGGNFMVLYDDSWNGDFRRAYTLHSWKTESNICEYDYRDAEKIMKKIEEEF